MNEEVDTRLSALRREVTRRMQRPDHLRRKREIRRIDLSARLCVLAVSLVLARETRGLIFGLSLICVAVTLAGLVSHFHDAVHHSLFGSRPVNVVMAAVLGAPFALSYSAWRHRHVRVHHARPGHAALDCDIQFHGLGRVHPSHPRKVFHQLQHLYMWGFHTLTLSHMLGGQDVLTAGRARRCGRGRLAIAMASKYFPFLVFWAGIGVLVAPDLPRFSATFLVVQLVGGLVVGITTQCHHNTLLTVPASGDDDDLNNLDWQLRHTADVAPTSPLVRALTGAGNLHVLHHLVPMVSSYDAVLLEPVLDEMLAIASVDRSARRVHPTMRAALRSHWQLVRRLGRAAPAGAGRMWGADADA